MNQVRLIDIPLWLAFSGLFIKVLFNCFMEGWSLL